MLSARGVPRAGAILPSFRIKYLITLTNKVLSGKFLQCEILQHVLHGESAFSGRTLGSTGIDDTPSADTTGPVWDQNLIDTLREVRGYHRKAIRAVNQFIAQAKANAGITVPSGVAQKFGRR